MCSRRPGRGVPDLERPGRHRVLRLAPQRSADPRRDVGHLHGHGRRRGGVTSRVVVTGTSDEFGTGTSTSAAVAGKPGPGPVATTGPVVSGSGQVGLRADLDRPHSGILPETVSTLQWVRNGQPISAATSASYVRRPRRPQQRDRAQGHRHPAGPCADRGDEQRHHGRAGPAATATTPPTIQGVAKVGSESTAVAPTWDQSGVQNNIHWLRDGIPVTGATVATYTVRLETSVRRSRSGTSAGRRVAPMASPRARRSRPRSVTPPRHSAARTSGPAKVGTTLTATAPSWDEGGVQNSYRVAAGRAADQRRHDSGVRGARAGCRRVPGGPVHGPGRRLDRTAPQRALR